MGRKRIVELTELMEATEALLLEVGYQAFNFKLLAERLNVARSTIYEYFSNKDELITSYMVNIMDKIIKELEQVEEETASHALKKMLSIFMKYWQIHRIVEIMPYINESASLKVEQSLQKMSDDHDRLFSLLIDWIKKGKQQNEIRSDVPDELIAGLFFNSIQLPYVSMLGAEQAANVIFDIFMKGLKNN